MKITFPLCFAALASVAACSSGGSMASRPVYVTAQSTSSSGSYAMPVTADSPPPSPGGYGASVQSEASASRSSAGGDGMSSTPSSQPVDVAPSARPGLATEWGESLRSEMSYAPFVRASSQPIDVAAIHYNDAHMAAMQAMQHSARPTRWVGIRHDGIRVSLRDEGGAPLQGYFAGDTVYVLGSSGQRYTILIENTTAYRYESVVSVDGLDVIRGQPASTGQRGYILPAYGRVEIEGFRQSTDTVAAFRFGSVGDSYAAQTGDARNVGVIGVALFAERGAPVDLEQNEVNLRERANPFPNGFAQPPARQYYY